MLVFAGVVEERIPEVFEYGKGEIYRVNLPRQRSTVKNTGSNGGLKIYISDWWNYDSSRFNEISLQFLLIPLRKESRAP